MDVNTLRQNWEKVSIDNEATIDADGGDYAAFDAAWKFEAIGAYVRVQFEMGNSTDRSYVTNNPAYVIMETAYLIQSMRADGYEMVSYTDFDDEMVNNHYLHNGSGIQMYFKPIE
jgi:hypothetical protein